MAYQRGSLKQVSRKQGDTWVLRYRISTADGKRVENIRTVGFVRDFPTKSDAWREVDKLGLLVRINDASLQARIRFNALAEHYLKADFVFSSFRAEGKVPLSAGVFVADYLRPAAIAAGVSIENGQRFGLHNLRHSLSNWLVNKAKVEPKTVQGILQTTLRAGLWVVTIGCHSF